MPTNRIKNALFGQAAGESIGLIFEMGNAEKLSQIIQFEQRMPNAQVDHWCKKEEAQLPGLHGNATLLTMLMVKRWNEKQEEVSTFHASLKDSFDEIAQKNVLRQPPLQHMTAAIHGKIIRDVGIGPSLWLLPCIELSTIDQLMMWSISFCRTCASDPSVIATGALHALICWHVARDKNVEDALSALAEWRSGSNALQSPIPDKTWWALEQALWIRKNYGQEPMLDFVKQFMDLPNAPEHADPRVAISFWAEATHHGLEAQNHNDLIMRIAGFGAWSGTLGAMAGTISGLRNCSPPAWVKDQLLVRDAIEFPERWTVSLEMGFNEELEKYRQNLPEPQPLLKKRRGKRTAKIENPNQMKLFLKDEKPHQR